MKDIMKDTTRAIAAAVAASAIWGLSFIFTKDVLSYVGPNQLMGLRFAVAALTMTLLSAAGIIHTRINREAVKDLLKVAILQPVIYFCCETYGIKYTTASEAGVIIAMIPLTILVLSFFMLKEKIRMGQLVSIVLAVAGVVLLVQGGQAAAQLDAKMHTLGVLMLLGAVLSGSLYNIYSGQASGKYTAMEITMVMMWLGALVFNGVAIAQGAAHGHPFGYLAAFAVKPVLFSVLYLGVISSVGAFFALNYALGKLKPTQVSVFLNLIPVVTLAAATLVYGERLSVWQMGGSLLILIGVWGANVRRDQSSRENAVS